MARRQRSLSIDCALVAAFILTMSGCAREKPEPAQAIRIPDGEIDPAAWGKIYPVEYEAWKMTGLPGPAEKSRYKRGFDADGITSDKLSEFPFLALLLNGWGMGIEYNEPRGHSHMVRDQLEVDSARLRAGGVCLTCKTPYAPKLRQEMGEQYFNAPFKEVLSRVPAKHKLLGVTCADCHDNRDMKLKLSREFTLGEALKDMGADRTKLTRQEMKSLVCAQCHVSYVIPKDNDMRSTGVFFPWQGSTWGNISIENIIAKIRSDPAYSEWTQSVTGFRMGFIRHPEFEFYSYKSRHWKVGVACGDCHMPVTEAGGRKVADHHITSPLKNDLKACEQCHIARKEWLRQQVYAVQDRTIADFIRTGYATATVAKLFEMVHKKQTAGRRIDQTLYQQAKGHYEEAFYRVVFIGAENSLGFHNPAEARRILTDAAGHAAEADNLLRQAMANAGIPVPAKVNLHLAKYLNQRGEKKLMFHPEHEITPPAPTPGH